MTEIKIEPKSPEALSMLYELEEGNYTFAHARKGMASEGEAMLEAEKTVRRRLENNGRNSFNNNRGIAVGSELHLCELLLKQIDQLRASPAPDPVRTDLADEKERHDLAVKIDTWSPQSRPLALIARERRLIVAALRAQGSGTFPLGSPDREAIARALFRRRFPYAENPETQFTRYLSGDHSNLNGRHREAIADAYADSDAILSLPAEGGAREGWQPIETAPKDGTKVDLLYDYPRGRAIDCMWRDDGGWFWLIPQWGSQPGLGIDWHLLPEDEWEIGSYPNMEPTHWMPAVAIPRPHSHAPEK